MKLMEADPVAKEFPVPQSEVTTLEPPLPPPVEALLQKICVEQSQTPPDAVVRRRLAAVGEEGAKEILERVAARKVFTGHFISRTMAPRWTEYLADCCLFGC
ncbi:unnamed protein product [Cuscuta epithymum]|uniref:RDRP3-5 N-terminal domain-containing protein n=1 Tax=Cuscuta epithymum TaxID=186058 RepID=A0AAV0BZS5_9ASTE|nr:unnamed protein product [Cuscuta epithymum]